MSSRSRFYFRPEHNDAGFIDGLSGRPPFDAAIVPARYLAAYPDEPTRDDPDGLAAALEAKGIHYLIDPGIPELCMPSFERRASTRHRESPIAVAARQLPANLARDRGALDHFGDAVLAMQTRAAALAPAHFELQFRNESEVLALNLALLGRALESTPAKPVVAFLQWTQLAFERSQFTRVAASYRATGANHVLLRVRRIDHDAMSRIAFESYMRAIDAFERQEIEVTIDCAGRSGPAQIAAGASGVSTGWLHFHAVAMRPFGSGGGRGATGAFELPGKFVEVVPDDAMEFASVCPHSGCRAHLPSASTFERRLHFLHALRDEVEDAGRRRLAYADRLIAAGGHARIWGMALADAARRAA